MTDLCLRVKYLQALTNMLTLITSRYDLNVSLTKNIVNKAITFTVLLV